jgi:hypothetical protein
MVTFSWYALAIVLGALNSGLTIETRTPDAHCPDVAATRKAADERLGVVDVAGQGRWRAVYAIVYAPDTSEGNRVHLELFDPKGQRRLERDLPIRGESCGAMAEVLVVVLERYFRDLGSTNEMEAARDSASTPLTPEPAPADKTQVAPTPSRDEERPIAAWTLGGGFLSPPAAPAIALEAKLWIAPSVHAGLGAAWSPVRTEESVGPGMVRGTFVPVRAYVGFGRRFAAGYAYAGPEVLASFDQAKATGIAAPGDAIRVVFGAGAAGGAFFWLRKPWAFSISAAVDGTLPLAMSQFVVSQEEVLRQKWVQGVVSMGLTLVTMP